MIPALRFESPMSPIGEWSCFSGERWLLSAPSGWGKTVWLKRLALLRDARDCRVFWNGRIVEPGNATLYRSRWIYLSQLPVRPAETIEAHLSALAGLSVHSGKDPKSLVERAKKRLDELGLFRLLTPNRTLDRLSGGELQALTLIRSVVLEPEGVFLDEPTAAMDEALRRRCEDWLLENFHGTFVWVTHDEEQMRRLEARGVLRIPIEPCAERIVPSS